MPKPEDIKEQKAEDIKQQSDQEYKFLPGPRQKNLATEHLEYIVYACINNSAKFYVHNSKELFVRIGKEKLFNLTQILKFADFEHLSFSKHLLDGYEAIFDSKSLYNKIFDKWPLTRPHPHLHMAEKIAINIWTHGYKTDLLENKINAPYENMQNLLLGKYKSIQEDIENFDYLLATICIASHGLAKPNTAPAPSIDKVMRGEWMDDTKLFRERYEKSSRGELVVNHGFTATARGFWALVYDVTTIFYEPYEDPKNPTPTLNALGKDISQLSDYKKESEVLFPPNTEFYYQLPDNKGHSEFWLAYPSRSIEREKDYKYEHPLTSERIKLIKIFLQLDMLNKFFINAKIENTHSKIRSFFDSVDNTKKLLCINGIIEVLNSIKETEEKLINPEKPINDSSFAIIYNGIQEVIAAIQDGMGFNIELVNAAAAKKTLGISHSASLGKVGACLAEGMAIIREVEAEIVLFNPEVKPIPPSPFYPKSP